MDYLSRTGASSAFKSSGGHELILLGNIEAPPPTTYDLVSVRTTPCAGRRARQQMVSRAQVVTLATGLGAVCQLLMHSLYNATATSWRKWLALYTLRQH